MLDLTSQPTEFYTENATVAWGYVPGSTFDYGCFLEFASSYAEECGNESAARELFLESLKVKKLARVAEMWELRRKGDIYRARKLAEYLGRDSEWINLHIGVY